MLHLPTLLCSRPARLALLAGLAAAPAIASAQVTFPVTATYTTGAKPVFLTSGNFSGHTDGRIDLATANQTGSSLSVFVVTSGGAVTTTTVPTIAVPSAAFAAEMTCVGFDDLIVANASDLYYVKNTGSGTSWTNATIMEGGINTKVAVAAKFDASGVVGTAAIRISDGKVMTRRSNAATGDGCGGYPGAANSIVPGTTAVALAIGQFNATADASKDLLVLNNGSSNVTVLLFSAFQPPFNGIDWTVAPDVSVGPNPIAIAAGKFNADGFDDFAVACVDSTVRVYLGNGDGSFTGAGVYSVPRSPVAIAAGDLTGDGRADIAVVCTGALSTPTATFSSPGVFPGGAGFESFATALSYDTSLVVGYGDSTSGTQAFRASGGITGLGDITGGSFASKATAVSQTGGIIYGWGTSASGPEACRWNNPGSAQELGDLSGGAFDSAATACSNTGGTIVGYGTSAAGREAVRWTNGGATMTSLLDLAGGSFGSAAWACSADGNTVVGEAHSSRSGANTEAFRWTLAGGMVGLGDIPGGTFNSNARGISPDGQTVVGVGSNASGNFAFQWSPRTHLFALPTAAGATGSRALDASSGAAAIVGAMTFAAGDLAYRWTPADGAQNILSLLTVQGASGLTGWTLTEATAVSEFGSTIIGNGLNGGRHQAWLAQVALPPTALVLVNDGAGAFTPAAAFGLGNGPSGVVIGKVGAEAYPAVIVSHSVDNNVKVYRNMVACPVDVDRNGAIEPADVALFVSSWFTSLSGSTLAGDWDLSGDVAPADIAAYVSAWLSALTSGC